MTAAAQEIAPANLSLWERIQTTLGMIKFAHSIFALPFALLAAVMAAGGWPAWHRFLWIVVACVCARSAAMSFNRLHDERFDRLNPRTKNWALPAGLLTRKFVRGFCIACSAGFIAAAAMLNTLALALSPLTLVVLLGYSTAKRWTAGAHFLLGFALGLAPIGAWVAVRGTIEAPPLLLCVGVMAWVAGFDIIYSCQDERFDRQQGLHSLPARWGRPHALAISALCHAVAIVFFALAGWSGGLGNCYLATLAIAACLLAYEQSLVSPQDLSKLGTAFFTVNGWISMLMLAGGLADLLLR